MCCLVQESVAEALWTLRGTQTQAMATDWDALTGHRRRISARQRTGAHGPDGPMESAKR
jgi:hypothetical protein